MTHASSVQDSPVEVIASAGDLISSWELLAGWVNRRQQQVIDYLLEENRVLREQLGGRRLRFTDDQRRRLAAKGKLLGRRLLGKFAGINAGRAAGRPSAQASSSLESIPARHRAGRALIAAS
jgi:hypothetical protein